MGSPAVLPRTHGGGRDSAPTPFISSRNSGNFWIIRSPAVALLIMFAAWRFSGLSDLAVFSILFSLIVTGQHMPGWIRAFGEPAIYERHKAEAWCDLAGALATVGQTREALDTLVKYRSRHPEDRVAADLERAIRADASR